jgi:hypothetical protein
MEVELAACAALAAEAAAPQADGVVDVLDDNPVLPAGRLTLALTPFAVDDAAALARVLTAPHLGESASSHLSYTRLLLDDEYDLDDGSLDPAQEAPAASSY